MTIYSTIYHIIYNKQKIYRLFTDMSHNIQVKYTIQVAQECSSSGQLLKVTIEYTAIWLVVLVHNVILIEIFWDL